MWLGVFLGQLLDAGMDVARLNFSHGDHQVHLKSLMNLREAMAARPGRHCAVLLDTKGPEIRSGFLKRHRPVHLKVCRLGWLRAIKQSWSMCVTRVAAAVCVLPAIRLDRR